MWMKIVNECLYNGDEDGIIIVGERGVWKIWLYFFDNEIDIFIVYFVLIFFIGCILLI